LVKAIAQMSQTGRRETFAGDTAGLGARISRNGNASHRGHGGHRGGTWVSARKLCRGHRWPACENPPNGKASMILRFPARRPFHQNNFQCHTQFPLCAMLSSLRVVLARQPRCPPNSFPEVFLFNGSLGKSASEPRTLPVRYPRRPQSLPGFSPQS
jgi:hypothetical protein